MQGTPFSITYRITGIEADLVTWLLGKITKVLNMRPAEILSMIEEAAGTSMFEEKKEKAVKTMAKKEKRLDEIQEVSLSFSRIRSPI